MVIFSSFFIDQQIHQIASHITLASFHKFFVARNELNNQIALKPAILLSHPTHIISSSSHPRITVPSSVKVYIYLLVRQFKLQIVGYKI